MTFDEVYQIVEESSTYAAFNKDECVALHTFAQEAPTDRVFVEIGVQFGRSLSVLAMVAQEKGTTVYGIDNWGEDVSSEARSHIKAKIQKYNWPVKLIEKMSHDAIDDFKKEKGKIFLLHVDGDHDYDGVATDCKDWCPLVEVGGYVCFDDYGHDSLPEVYKAVCEYMGTHPEWQFVARYGDKLGVFRRIK